MVGRLNRVERLEESRAGGRRVDCIIKPGYSFDIVTPSETISYIPSETGKQFHASNLHVKAIMGPFGSGKSTACCAEVILQACSMPKDTRGRRKSRYAFIRNTAGELETTTLKTWLSWFGELGGTPIRRKKPVLTYEYAFNDLEGRVDLEIIFLALDREEDVKKLKSLELTGAYINEATEIPKIVFEILTGRINRYPAKREQPNPYYSYIMMDYNPPSPKHYLYDMFERGPSNKHAILFKQPGGLQVNEHGEPRLDGEGDYIANTECDNYKHLSPTYYIDMARNLNLERVRVFCLGEYGIVKDGKPVYGEYNDDLHSVPHLEYRDDLPIDIGWDFGLTPSAIISQTHPSGRLFILKEFTSDHMGITSLAENIVIPYLVNNYKNYNIRHSTGDPAGARGAETDERSCMNILTELGVPTEGAATNAIVPRVEAVKWWLGRMIEGKPAITISREGCPVLREGFMGGYHYAKYRMMVEEKYKERPEKNAFSHVHDALQYSCLRLAPAQSTNNAQFDAQFFQNFIPGGVYG